MEEIERYGLFNQDTSTGRAAGPVSTTQVTDCLVLACGHGSNRSIETYRADRVGGPTLSP